MAEADIERRTGRRANQPVPSARPYDAVEVLYRMTNSIVVSLMKSCDDNMDKQQQTKTLLFASEKAVTSYFLLHLLMCLCRTRPEIHSNANAKLQQFIQDPKARLKQTTPDLGQLIIMITLVLLMAPVNKAPAITWELIRGPFLQEAVTRNIRTQLDRVPELQVLESGPSDYRIETAFDCSKTSLRLMFQITFLNVFLETYGAEISRLDDNYGFADKGMPERMVGEIKDIYQVQSWPRFFGKVNFGKMLSKVGLSEMLRKTVKESARKGYHQPASSEEIREFSRKRADLDQNVH